MTGRTCNADGLVSHRRSRKCFWGLGESNEQGSLLVFCFGNHQLWLHRRRLLGGRVGSRTQGPRRRVGRPRGIGYWSGVLGRLRGLPSEWTGCTLCET